MLQPRMTRYNALVCQPVGDADFRIGGASDGAGHHWDATDLAPKMGPREDDKAGYCLT